MFLKQRMKYLQARSLLLSLQGICSMNYKFFRRMEKNVIIKSLVMVLLNMNVTYINFPL